MLNAHLELGKSCEFSEYMVNLQIQIVKVNRI